MQTAELIGDKVIIDDEAKANSIHSKGFIGNLIKIKLELSIIEAYYLFNKKKIVIIKNKKELNETQLIKKFLKLDKNFMIKYLVFKDLRDKGYVIKTALKYGFDFRVYNKGIKPGDEHAKWLVNCTKENEVMKIKDYSKLIRIGHSVRKNILLAVVDFEDDITYWESNWIRI